LPQFNFHAKIIMSTFRRSSFRFIAIALAFICLGIHSSSLLSGKCMWVNHDGKHGNHHENRDTDEWSSPDYFKNYQSFYISHGRTCDKELLSKSKLISSVAQVRPAGFIQTDHQHTTFSLNFLSKHLIIKTLRL